MRCHSIVSSSVSLCLSQTSHTVSHTVLISRSLSSCPHVTPQLCLSNCLLPSITLPLSPTYRWWAHLCGCLSHLTTRLRSRRRHSGERTWAENTGTKAQRRCWWCHHRAKLSTTGRDDNNPPSSNPWWLTPVFHQENGRLLYGSELDMEVWCAGRKCWMFLMNVKNKNVLKPTVGQLALKITAAHHVRKRSDLKTNTKIQDQYM